MIAHKTLAAGAVAAPPLSLKEWAGIRAKAKALGL